MRKGALRHQAKKALERLNCSAFVESILVPEDSRRAFYDLCEGFFSEYNPCGASEEASAILIASLTWRKLHPLDSIRKTRPPLNPRELPIWLKVVKQEASPERELGTVDAEIQHAHSHMLLLKQMKKLAGLSQ